MPDIRENEMELRAIVMGVALHAIIAAEGPAADHIKGHMNLAKEYADEFVKRLKSWT